MSEQAAPADGGEATPAVAGPEGTPGAVEQPQDTSQETDDRSYQQRYVDIQREYTRSQMENGLYKRFLASDDPDTRREILEQLGYEFEEEPEPEPDNPLDAYGARIEALEQYLAERDQEAENDAYVAQMQAVVDERLDAMQIPKDDQEWVLSYAVNALPATEEGLPDIEQAFQLWQAHDTARQKRWAQSKRAPRISPDGQAATEAPNLDDRQQRQDFILRRMQDGEAGY